jgi:hypothetical protein
MRIAAIASGQSQRCSHRQDQRAFTQSHYLVALAADALPVAGLVLEPLEPVPVAPIELVPLELGEDDEVSLDAVPVEPVELLPMLAEPLPLEPGVVLALPVVLEPVPLEPVVEPGPPPPRLQADNESAATTERMAAVAWVRVIFIRKLLESVMRSA